MVLPAPMFYDSSIRLIVTICAAVSSQAMQAVPAHVLLEYKHVSK